MMSRLSAVLSLFLLAAPALAAEKQVERPRLVVGNAGSARLDADSADRRIELLGGSGFSLGAMAGSGLPAALAFTEAGGRDRLSLGGYAGFTADAYRLGSSLRNDGLTTSADLTAATSSAVLGFAGTTALKLGADITRPQEFSLNAATPGLAYDPVRTGSDLSLTLSWTRDVTPAFSFGGMAAASRPMSPADGQAGSSFTVGAGLGLKF